MRLSATGLRGGRNGFETQLRTWAVTQKNSRPNHPTTCGKVERFQQTLKKWLRAQPRQPSTITELQVLIDQFRHDRIDKSGTLTLRVEGKLRHIGIGRTHKGTHVVMLIQDLNVRVVNAITGEILRELTIDRNKDYQPRGT